MKNFRFFYVKNIDKNHILLWHKKNSFILHILIVFVNSTMKYIREIWKVVTLKYGHFKCFNLLQIVLICDFLSYFYSHHRSSMFNYNRNRLQHLRKYLTNHTVLNKILKTDNHLPFQWVTGPYSEQLLDFNNAK